jgi:deoxyribodipyrimidine photo-lyase
VSVLAWFRLDLRLADNPALDAAVAGGAPVIPVFVYAPEEEGEWAPGAASRWWLHRSLGALERSLADRGSRLIIRRGPAAEALAAVAEETGASTVYFNRRYEPYEMERERRVAQALRVESFPGDLLFAPGAISKSDGTPFRIFTAFWNACRRAPGPRVPLRAPNRIPAPARWPRSLAPGEPELAPQVDRAAGFEEAWRPGERHALDRMHEFFEHAVRDYAADRDRPDRDGTSRLSPHLHFGEISARQVWHAAYECAARDRGMRAGVEAFVRQLVWREFAHHLLFHFPHTPLEPLRPEFREFPWRADERKWNAWTQGGTGYPLVDAGMRQLWRTGWMHNRVRLVAASFLVKHLLIPWQRGAKWFWDTLVDADLANNTLNWQWVAGCGADAAPFFRVFNPAAQAKKFDPEGAYVERWAPGPWPPPIVGHERAREEALEAWAAIRRKRSC